MGISCDRCGKDITKESYEVSMINRAFELRLKAIEKRLSLLERGAGLRC
jgi:hypothetical protein